MRNKKSSDVNLNRLANLASFALDSCKESPRTPGTPTIIASISTSKTSHISTEIIDRLGFKKMELSYPCETSISL